jgi:GT2 family glycosyltransferase
MGKDIVSIIVLCFNQSSYTRQTIDSILKHTRYPYELIVVDNGSSDTTAEYLHQLMPHSEYLKGYKPLFNQENRGVASALNQAIRIAEGTFLCHLNNDIIVTDPWLNNIVACARREHGIGIVGCCTNPVKNPHGGFPSLEGCRSYQEVQRTGAMVAIRNHGKFEPAHIVHGFCMLIDRRVIERIGYFDEGYYPMNGEDIDFCFRTLKAGFRIVIALDAFVFHFYNTTGKSAELRRAHGEGQERERKARERFLQKWKDDGARYFDELEKRASLEQDRVRKTVPCSETCVPA